MIDSNLDKEGMDGMDVAESIEVETINNMKGEVTMTEEKKYIVDPEFKNLIGRTDEEYARLKEAIRGDGIIREDYAVWKETGILVNGSDDDVVPPPIENNSKPESSVEGNEVQAMSNIESIFAVIECIKQKSETFTKEEWQSFLKEFRKFWKWLNDQVQKK